MVAVATRCLFVTCIISANLFLFQRSEINMELALIVAFIIAFTMPHHNDADVLEVARSQALESEDVML